MIIWSGLGFLPAVFFVAFVFAFSNHPGAPTSGEMGCALLLAGLASGGLGWWLRNRPGRVVIDQATGKQMVLRSSHSLFFIPIFYWGFIFTGFAAYQFVQALIKH